MLLLVAFIPAAKLLLLSPTRALTVESVGELKRERKADPLTVEGVRMRELK